MSYEYAGRRRTEASAGKTEAVPAQPSLDALRSGAAAPTAEQMGRRVDLPDAMREKMESAFGADLSAVKLYESETVAEAGANAVTQGSDIAFAPGMLDFTSFGGQALLGHEISHVVSQARGEVAGGGFLNDASLEARADREGAMAAAGQEIAAPMTAMSSVSAAPSAGPMQAKKTKEDIIKQQQKQEAIRGQMDQYISKYALEHGDDSSFMRGTDFYQLMEEAKTTKGYKKLNDQMTAARAKEDKYRRKVADSDSVPRLSRNPLMDAVDLARATYKTGDVGGGQQYGRAVSSIMDNTSVDEVRANTAVQQALLDEAGSAVNAGFSRTYNDPEAKSKNEALTSAVSYHLRGSSGDANTGAFYGMIRQMMGGEEAISSVVQSQDASQAEAAMAPVADLLQQFSDRVFEGTDVSDEHRSNIIMNNSSNRTFGAVSHYDPRLVRAGGEFQKSVGLKNDSPVPSESATPQGKRFLSFLHRRKNGGA